MTSILPTRAAKECQESPLSYQVLNATTGEPANQLNLLKKRHFRQSPWFFRLLSKFRRQKTINSHQELISMTPEKQQVLIQQILAQLEEMNNPATFKQVLEPFFSILDSKCQTKEHSQSLHLFCTLLTTIVDSSAAFLQQSHKQETLLDIPQDHFRAVTNYWVYIILNDILSSNKNKKDTDNDVPMPLLLNTDVYAYSFLYPYSDDLLDGMGATLQEKATFCGNIERLILGESLEQHAFTSSTTNTTLHECECRVYHLLNQVLYSKHNSHALRDSFCAINHAQVTSMKQHVDSNTLQAATKGNLSKEFEEKLFDISVQKGVASVLPNAYLIKSALSLQEANLAAVIGTMGQFINDVEGLMDDWSNQSLTPALVSHFKHGNLDRFMEKCMVYMERQLHSIPQGYSSLPRDKVELLFHVVKLRLLIAATVLNQEYPKHHVLSSNFTSSLETQLGVEASMLAMLGRLERQVFGNNDSNERHQLDSPEQFRLFLVQQLKRLIDNV